MPPQGQTQGLSYKDQDKDKDKDNNTENIYSQVTAAKNYV